MIDQPHTAHVPKQSCKQEPTRERERRRCIIVALTKRKCVLTIARTHARTFPRRDVARTVSQRRRIDDRISIADKNRRRVLFVLNIARDRRTTGDLPDGMCPCDKRTPPPPPPFISNREIVSRALEEGGNGATRATALTTAYKRDDQHTFREKIAKLV